jgi:porin
VQTSAQSSISFKNNTDYLSELLAHTSPNEGNDLHFIGWLLNTSQLSFDSRHSLNLGLMLTHGGEPSANIVGDLQTFSNIEAGFLYGFNEFFYQYEQDNFWLKVGQQDINTDFMVSETGLFFTHSSFGIDPLTTINIPAPTYPVVAFAATTSFKVSKALSLRLAVFDGQFALPQNDYLTIDWSMNKDEGLIYVIEPEISLLQGRWSQKAGFYHHSGLFNKKEDGSVSRGLSTFYLVADIQLKEWADKRLDLFYQFSTASKSVSDLDYYFGAGLKMTNPFGNRPEDELGLAVGYASINTQFQSVRDVYGISDETAIELSYKIKMKDWLTLQPYFHYIGINEIGQERQNPVVFAVRGIFSF